MMALLILSGLWLGAEAQSRPPCNPDTPAGRAAAGIVEAASQAKARDAAVFEQAARQSAQRVSQATDCLARATEAVNQQIPNFGGGMLGALTAQLTQNLANQACSVVGQAQQRAPTQGGQMPGMPGMPSLPNIPIVHGEDWEAAEAAARERRRLQREARERARREELGLEPAPAPAPTGVVGAVGGALSRLF